MAYTWIAETPPHWDAAKSRIIAAAPPGVFSFPPYKDGDLLPGQWWRVERDGQIVGYGWLDMNWGDGEILLAVDPAFQREGAGGFILDRMQEEARARGLSYLYNVIPAAHPEPSRLAAWLDKHGFRHYREGRLTRAVTHRK